MEVIQAIKTRRSVREFEDKYVEDEVIEQILEAGRWAPSGLNNQAWRFVVVRNKDSKAKLSQLTHYGSIILRANVLIVVFLDKEQMYDYTKDVQSIGACIQNMLLAIHALGLGGVWLGEILKNKSKVNDILKAPVYYELMGVVALGYPTKKSRRSDRKELTQLVFRERYAEQW